MNETLLKLKKNLEIALNHFNFDELTIKRVLLAEIAQFEKTLANGEKNLNDFFKKMKKNY